MGFSLSKAFGGSSGLGALAGGAIGGFFGGPSGAVAGSQIGGAILGGSDDEMTALDAYNMQKRDNIAFWNMQNAYNDPASQMARYEKAGINPYMAISGGGVSAGNAGSIDAPTYNGSYAQPLSVRLTKALQNLNLRSMQATTKTKEIDSEMRELDLQLKRARIASLLSGRSGKLSIDDKANNSLQLRLAKMTTAERRAYRNSLPEHALILNNLDTNEPIYEKYTGKVKKAVGRALKNPWSTAVDFIFG